MSKFKPSELRISTITALCGIGCEVPLVELNEHLEVNDKICYIRFKDVVRGQSKKTKKKKSTKSFYNQVTLIVNLPEEYKSINGGGRSINVKVFKNGQLQMTGVKSDAEGHAGVGVLIAELERVFREKEYQFSECNYKTVLINSDFRIGYKVNRQKLYELLDAHYGMYVSYEPCIYPGVNAKYFWNSTDETRSGICHCDKMCNGKGSGTGSGECKKVTIATFQSGTVIITGANTMEQLRNAYDYICGVFEKHEHLIKKREIPLPTLNRRFGLLK